MTLSLRFEPAGVEVSVRAAERVLDIADDHPELGLVVACRASNCGSCRVRIEAGLALLAPPATREHEELRRLGSPPAERLGCQLRVTSDTTARGLIVLRLADHPR